MTRIESVPRFHIWECLMTMYTVNHVIFVNGSTFVLTISINGGKMQEAHLYSMKSWTTS